MEEKGDKMRLTKTKYLGFALFFSVFLGLVLTGCVKKPTTDEKSQATRLNPTEAAANFLNCTFIAGLCPEERQSEQIAQHYLSPELMGKWNQSSFIPLTFCIQQGPDFVKISKEKIENNQASVTIAAMWGFESTNPYNDKWQLDLEIIDGEWKITEIKCLD